MATKSLCGARRSVETGWPESVFHSKPPSWRNCRRLTARRGRSGREEKMDQKRNARRRIRRRRRDSGAAGGIKSIRICWKILEATF